MGYRSVDGAQAYGNDIEIGRAVLRAINEGIVTREELFIATKISMEEHAGYDRTKVKYFCFFPCFHSFY